MKLSLKNITTPSIPMAVLLIAACILLWLSAYWGNRSVEITPAHNQVVRVIEAYLLPNIFWSNLAGLLFTLLNVLLITQLNSRFAIIRTRTFLPILIFFLLLDVWNQTHLACGSHLALTIFLLGHFFLFDAYRDRKAAEQAFLSSFFIALSSIILNPLAIIIPVLWIGLIIFQCFSLRTWLASILGAIAPWLVFLSVMRFLQQDLDWFTFLNKHFYLQFTLPTVSILSLVYIVAIAAVMVVCLIGMFTATINDSIHTRARLNYLILLMLVILFVAYFFCDVVNPMLPFIAFTYAILAAHSFSLKESKFWSILFIIFCTINLIFIIFTYLPQ